MSRRPAPDSERVIDGPETGERRVLTTADEDSGQRLDRFLAAHLSDATRSACQRWIREGRVQIDGRPVLKAGAALEPGMFVELVLPPPGLGRPIAQSIPLNVLYEDDDLIVVDKPAGLVVHPGHGRPDGTVVNALLGRGTPLAAAGSPQRPGIVHRLDAGTSGVLAVAKTDAAHHALASAFARRVVTKVYVALVWGRPRLDQGTIDRPIGRSRADRLKMSVTAARGRAAVTRYRKLESLPGFALLSVRPETGRTHQIRVHLQSIHHPIVGDERYGGRAWRGLQDPLKRKAVRGFDRLALHAAELTFTHPTSGRELCVRAPLPEDFEALLSVLRRTGP